MALSDNTNVYIKRISNSFNDIELPGYSTEGSAGADLRAAIEDQLIIKKGEVKLIPTNLMVEIPEGYELQVRPRSGLAAKHGIGVLNSPGTIDSDYRGEVKVALINLGPEPVTIKRGDRIAQMVIQRVYQAGIKVVERLDETDRGNGGFGHTGR